MSPCEQSAVAAWILGMAMGLSVAVMISISATPFCTGPAGCGKRHPAYGKGEMLCGGAGARKRKSS